jgi:hypothetical protein
MNRRRTSPSAGTRTGYGELERHRARAQELRAEATAAILTSLWRALALQLRAAARQAHRSWRRRAEATPLRHARRSDSAAIGSGTS